MKFKYETHMHTSEVCLCGRTAAADYIGYYKSRGYAGIFITDHFYCTKYYPSIEQEFMNRMILPDNSKWEEYLQHHFLGYDAAVAAAARVENFDVFFAWEYSYGWAHFLTYGLDKEWLLNNPEMYYWEPEEYFDRVHDADGFIIHAHPFRTGIEHVHLFPNKVDGIEVINASLPDKNNRYAADMADCFGLPHTAGSDMHNIANKKRRSGIITDVRISDSRHYLELLTAGGISVFVDSET